MLDLSLKNETKRYISLSTGIPFHEIEELDAESIERRIEQKIKKPLIITYSKRDRRMPVRGNVHILLERYIDMSIINEKLNKI